MISGGGGIGSTLTAGIQDIAAILPLLGTEQCSIHVSSALTRGYLYAASAPMSIFGSLRVVSAGFKTLVACFSFRDIEGAELRAPVCAQHYSIYLYKSGCQQPELEERHDMGIPDSAFYRRLHHSYPYSITHPTTNSHYFRPIFCQTRPAGSCQWRCRGRR